MLLIQTRELISRLDAIDAENLGTVIYPRLFRAPQIAVAHLDFLKGDWIRYWSEYKQRRGIIKKECDVFTIQACAEFQLSASLKSDISSQDFQASLFESRIEIQPGDSILGITNPLSSSQPIHHANCLVAFTTDNESFQLAFWEPQDSSGSFIYETIDSAIRRGIGLYDVLL